MRIRNGWKAAVFAAVCCLGTSAFAQFAGPGYGPPAMAPGMGPYMMPAPVYMDPAVLQASAGFAGDPGAGHCTQCESDCCPGGGWCYDFAVFADFLFLRARDSEVAYAVEVNSATAPPTVPVQVGRVGVADMDYQPAWRGGFTTVLDECSSLTAQYTMFEANTNSRVDQVRVGTEIQSMLFHPNTVAASTGGVFATAAYNMSYDLIDLDYRELFSYSCFHETNFLMGVRYANLEQQLVHNLSTNGTDSVSTDMDFDGIGARLGLETLRYSRRGLTAYGRGYTSLLVGDFSGTYDQQNTFAGSVVSTAWKAGRMVPILDLELGLGWTSENGYWRLSAGYLYSAWFNTVSTDEFIKSVQSNNFVGLGDGMTFDGLVARIESRF